MMLEEVERREGRAPDGVWDRLVTYADDIGPFFEVSYTFDTAGALRRVGYLGAFDDEAGGRDAYVWVKEAIRVVWGPPVVEDETYGGRTGDGAEPQGLRSAWDAAVTTVVLALEEATPGSFIRYLALTYSDGAYPEPSP